MRIFNTLFVFTLVFALTLGSCKNKEETVETETTTETEEVLDNMTEVEADEATADTVEADSTFITYERTPCFGQCQVFEVVIYKSGYAIYRGSNFVNNIGLFQGRLSDEQMESLRSIVEDINYFDFDEEYDNPNVTDLPAVITEVHMNGKELQVRNRYRGPQELKRFYEKLDLYLEQVEWDKLETEN